MEKIIYVNLDKCLGCHTCEIECAVEDSDSKSLFGAILEDPLPQARVSVEFMEGNNIPWQCRHCDDAPCETVCPTGAIGRENSESPVVIEKDKCIGCKMCLQVCPFGVIERSKAGGVVTKCDLCTDRLEEGAEPACVEGCPTNALEFITTKELAKKRREAAAEGLVAAFQKSESDVKMG
ncbi:4Fe-4S dicluster domain-containing protein [Acetohalobium arabaticum]|uniref:4Fe-4S ferredoxin iron-sulfur binding domain protein n=1 Tax=Acetohalobium arabaticum (strain ATCC 49924 / DSM 5501 / Z-7288) TaxID=574087 RepID=D9QPS2_ACEAZ|nr:4Fe-4S dicluster domain-containing protein [Acetohalobium arabaticum]ADL12513.1 4Fe-4S ferredoxin iron-sulfur binding domain protein [Acetohalobium arabaticum DSM 5501]